MEHDPSIWSTILAFIIWVGITIGFCFVLWGVNYFLFEKYKDGFHPIDFLDKK